MDVQLLKDRLIREGTLTLVVRVRPNASRSQWKAVMADGVIKIDLAAVPEDGKANEELLGFLSEEFDVMTVNISLVSGHTSKQKRLKITL